MKKRFITRYDLNDKYCRKTLSSDDNNIFRYVENGKYLKQCGYLYGLKITNKH